ncbi:MAG: BrnT family toxin [Hyphomicrobiales bacterium]
MYQLPYDPAKRLRTLNERGFDFEDARLVFAGPHYPWQDTRVDCGETRMLCFGYLEGRSVIVGYVERKGTHHIFTMKRADDRERKIFGPYVSQE